MTSNTPTSSDSRFNEEGDWIAQQFFSPEDLRMSPEEYVARHAHAVGCFSFHFYRYHDLALGAWVRRVGELNFSVVQRFVDEVVALPDKEIFEAMIWVMERCKLVVEGAAAAPVAALLHGLIKLPAGSRVAVVLSGGNVNLDQLRGLRWN